MIGRLWMAAVAVFLALPLVVVAGVSVNEKQSLIFPPEGFSLGWYGQVFTNPELAGRAHLLAAAGRAVGGAGRARSRCRWPGSAGAGSRPGRGSSRCSGWRRS